MSLKERVYSVLVVSAAENFTSSLLSLLPGSQYDPILTVSNVSAARRALLEREFDFIMVNSPLSDGDGVRFAIDACQKGAVVLLFARSEMYEGIFDKVAEHGVFTLPTLSLPAPSYCPSLLGQPFFSPTINGLGP